MTSFLDEHQQWLVAQGAAVIGPRHFPDEPPPPASWPPEIVEWLTSDMRRHYDLRAFGLGWHADAGLALLSQTFVVELLHASGADVTAYPKDPVMLWYQAMTCVVMAGTRGDEAGCIYWLNTDDLTYGRLAESLTEYFAMVRALGDAGVLRVDDEAPKWIQDLRPRPDSISHAPSPPPDTPAAIFGFPWPTLGDAFPSSVLTNPVAPTFAELMDG